MFLWLCHREFVCESFGGVTVSFDEGWTQNYGNLISVVFFHVKKMLTFYMNSYISLRHVGVY